MGYAVVDISKKKNKKDDKQEKVHIHTYIIVSLRVVHILYAQL